MSLVFEPAFIQDIGQKASLINITIGPHFFQRRKSKNSMLEKHISDIMIRDCCGRQGSSI